MSTEEKERLDPADLAGGGLLASSHLHRYELAGELCAGRKVLDLCCGTGYGSRVLARSATAVHGVDLSAEAVDVARGELTSEERDRVTFESGDALTHVRGAAQGTYEAIVCFEGIEHVPDPTALAAELARHAEGGALVVLSVPNSKGFEEDNQFHHTDFGYEEMLQLIEVFDAPALVEQYLVEGSVLRPSDRLPGDVSGALLAENRTDAAWASHWIIVVGAARDAIDGARGRFELAVTENQNAYMRALERANAELRAINAKMARDHLGVHDAAAANILRRFEERTLAAEQRLRDAEGLAKYWEDQTRKWNEIADRNDWAREQAQKTLSRARYRMADRVANTVNKLRPGR